LASDCQGKEGDWELKSWVQGQAVALFVSKKQVFGGSTIDVTIDAILYIMWKQNKIESLLYICKVLVKEM
jgi:hypothetical protein